jgi:dihydroorotate dehydrogenase
MENIEVIDKDKYNEILSNIKNKIITSNILTKEELDILNDYILSNNVKNKVLEETSNAWKEFAESGLLLYLNEYIVDKLGYVIKPLSEDYKNIRPISISNTEAQKENRLIMRFIKEYYNKDTFELVFKCPKCNKTTFKIDCSPLANHQYKFNPIIYTIKENLKYPLYCTLCNINVIEEILDGYKKG